MHNAVYAVRFVALLAVAAPLGALAADLNLEFVDGPAAPSTLFVALYDSADAYAGQRMFQAKTMSMSAGTSRLSFTGLAPGRYALRAFADENGNGKLDVNLMGMPIERYGFLNDAKGSFGPPTFDAASLVLDGDVNALIHLH